MNKTSWWRIWLMLALVSACEVVADFDREKLERQRTIGPTPLPTADGAVAVMPDAARADGALVRPVEVDAGELDAAAEAGPPDAATDVALVDAGEQGIDATVIEVIADDADATVVFNGVVFRSRAQGHASTHALE